MIQREDDRFGDVSAELEERLQAFNEGAGVAYLSTFGFQAPQFYASCGYVTFGELNDVPPGSKRIWLRKDLRPADRDSPA